MRRKAKTEGKHLITVDAAGMEMQGFATKDQAVTFMRLATVFLLNKLDEKKIKAIKKMFDESREPKE